MKNLTESANARLVTTVANKDGYSSHFFDFRNVSFKILDVFNNITSTGEIKQVMLNSLIKLVSGYFYTLKVACCIHRD